MTKTTEMMISRIAGFGFRAAATRGSLRDALGIALAATDQERPLTALATAEDKVSAAAMQSLARELSLPLISVPLSQIAAQDALPSSSHAPVRYGAQSLAEASALASAGAGARLLAPKSISGDGLATAAIAEGVSL